MGGARKTIDTSMFTSPIWIYGSFKTDIRRRNFVNDRFGPLNRDGCFSAFFVIVGQTIPTIIKSFALIRFVSTTYITARAAAFF
jgi:hypothetical protein